MQGGTKGGSGGIRAAGSAKRHSHSGSIALVTNEMTGWLAVFVSSLFCSSTFVCSGERLHLSRISPLCQRVASGLQLGSDYRHVPL